MAALRCFQGLNASYDLKINELNAQIKKLGNKKSNAKQKQVLQLKKENATELQGEIKTLFDEITETEKDKQVIKYLGLE